MEEYFNEEKEKRKKNIREIILKIVFYLIVLPFAFLKDVQAYHAIIIFLIVVIYCLARYNIELNYDNRKKFNDYVLKPLKEREEK